MSDRPPAFPFWLRSVLCLTASACFFALLVAVAYKIREGGEAIWLDGAIAQHVQPHLGPRRTRLALTLTQIGSPLFIVPATLAAALISAIVRRSIWTGIVVTATVGLVGLGSTAMKQMITAAHPHFAAQIPMPRAHLPVRSRGICVVADGDCGDCLRREAATSDHLAGYRRGHWRSWPPRASTSASTGSRTRWAECSSRSALCLPAPRCCRTGKDPDRVRLNRQKLHQ